ncbi:MAG: Phosphate regulon transcriptional regulatory protein PhoB [Chloroflexi bacterium]|nr:Phosphate regulon transcriptional regulatory protein PhoB [Chloroflexota bacterium]
MKKTKILIVDDEPQILRALRTGLLAHGYDVVSAADGEEALDKAATELPDAVILDLNLPKLSGLDVCRGLREWSSVPIIVLSVRDAERDKVAALDLGADDYLTKPFGADELLARLRVALRHAARVAGPPEPVVRAGEVMIDLSRHMVKRGEDEVRLTATEYKLLAYLATNAGRVLTHTQILEHVWGPGYESETQNLRVYVSQLRRKLDPNSAQPQMITTEPGVGYRFIADE